MAHLAGIIHMSKLVIRTFLHAEETRHGAVVAKHHLLTVAIFIRTGEQVGIALAPILVISFLAVKSSQGPHRLAAVRESEHHERVAHLPEFDSSHFKPLARISF